LHDWLPEPVRRSCRVIFQGVRGVAQRASAAASFPASTADRRTPNIP
jgi:hypothetical protein